MQPLVLAIEPDHRQAAIVKRIVREKVMADVTVVDSRDAALDAMRTTIPDVLLLSTLLSPRDEDELIAHLRTRRDAEHLQTHTIPQLSSSFNGEDEKPKGLLSAFRRKKTPDHAPTGCDPDLFAEEIRTYLKHASDKKRQVRESGPVDPAKASIVAPQAARVVAEPAPAPVEEPAGSSWASPFEWRPSQSRTAAPPPPEPEPAPFSEPAFEPAFAEPAYSETPSSIFDPPPSIVEPEPEPSYLRQEPSFIREEPSILLQESSTFDQYSPAVDAPISFAEPEPVDAEPMTTVSATIEEYVSSYAEPAVEAFVEPVVESYSSSVDAYSYTDSAWTPQVRYPLTLRTAKGWWFVEGKFTSVKEEAAAGNPDSELQEVLAGLAVPAAIAGVVYAEGCRIRRVRLAAA